MIPSVSLLASPGQTLVAVRMCGSGRIAAGTERQDRMFADAARSGLQIGAYAGNPGDAAASYFMCTDRGARQDSLIKLAAVERPPRNDRERTDM